MINYNDVLNTVGSRMEQAPQPQQQTERKPYEIPEDTPNLLNKIGLEVQRQGGAR